MSLRKVGFIATLALAVLSGCMRDLETPPTAQHGKVKGSLDTGGNIPLGGNVVTLVASDGSRQQQTSASDGSFVFGDVLPGSYYLDLSLPGFAPLLVPNVTVHTGQVVDLGVEKPAWLAGTPAQALVSGLVVVNGGGDANGGQVEFLLQPVNQRVALAAVGIGGVFTQAVPPGSYTLRASHPLYVTGQLDNVSVSPGQTVDLSSQPIALALNPATLTGTVLEERDGQPAAPAAGALVTLSGGVTTTCDAAGHFLISGLPAGTQTLRISASGYHQGFSDVVVQLSPGQTTALASNLTLSLDRGTLHGAVLVSDGQPALDVEVSVAGTSFNALVTPDLADPSHGSFQISGVPVGVYEVDASKPNYARGSKGSVSVQADTITEVGTLAVSPLQGDFLVDDGDPNNTPGYSRTPSVTLVFAGFGAAISYRASEDPSFTGVAFVPYSGASQPFTLSSGDGTKTVYAQYQDSAGTVSATFRSSVVLDSAAPAQPSLAIDSGAAFTSTSSPYYLTLQAQDPLPSGADTSSGLASVLINETGAQTGPLLTATPQPYQRDLAYLPSGAAEGAHAVYVQFLDHAGNASAIVSTTITVDTLRPTGSISISNGAGTTSPGLTRTALVTLDQSTAAEPNGGHVLIRLANSQAALSAAVFQPVSASMSWFIDATADGPKTVYAELMDAAGNVSSSPLTATITYDSTPPSPVSVALSGNAVTNSRQVGLNLSASDAVGLSPTQAVTVSLDPYFLAAGTVGPQAYSTSLNFDLGASEPDGLKQIYVRYRDAAGNEAIASTRVTLDTQPPSGTMTVVGTLADGSSSSSATSNPSVTVQLAQSGATKYALGNESLTDCSVPTYTKLTASSLPFTLSGSATPREVHLCLADDAGNTFGPMVQKISLDTAAPTGCAIALSGTKVDGTPAPFGRTANATVTAAISGCSETPTEIVLSTQPLGCAAINGFSWQPFSSSLPMTLLGPDGPSSVFACVRDAARNTGSAGSASITLDTQPPAAPLITIDSGALYVNGAQVSARGGYLASVQGSALGAIDWALSTTPSFAPADFAPYATNPRNLTFGGEGLRNAYAVFRDDVGNTTAVATSSITFDTQPPNVSGTSLSILTPSGNAYTNTVSVTLSLAGYPADATGLEVANAASAGACATSDLNGAPVLPFTPSRTHLLPGGDGPKRVCVTLIDAAGNASAISSQAVTLDTVPPSAPLIQTLSKVINAADNSLFTVQTVAPNTEADFARYEQLGGKITTWTTASTSIGTTQFDYHLVTSASAAAGVANALRLRAVDQAGNASPESSVVITTDVVAPQAVLLSQFGITNKDSSATVYWQPSPANTDVAGYNVYYGAASGGPNAIYNGTYATEGNSPIHVGPGTQSLTLSGLANGASTYVTVRPVDFAGNEGAPPGSPAELQLQPNRVAPTKIAQLQLGIYGTRITVVGDYAYVLGASMEGQCDSTTSFAHSFLDVVDLRRLVSPVQHGTLDPSTPPPALVNALTWSDNQYCPNGGNNPNPNYDTQQDMIVDGQWVFLTSGSMLRMLSVLSPAAPVELPAIDFSASTPQITALTKVGSTLFVHGGGATPTDDGVLFALDVSSLSDGDPATYPTITDALGPLLGTFNFPSGGAASRNWLLQSGEVSGVPYAIDMTNAIDGDGATPFNNTIKRTFLASANAGATVAPLASGNLLYTSTAAGLSAYDLSPLWTWTSGAYPQASLKGNEPTPGGLPFEVAGGEAFAVYESTSAGVVVDDLTNLLVPTAASRIEKQAAFQQDTANHGARGFAIYGPYLLGVDRTGDFSVLQTTTSTALLLGASMNGGSGSHEINGGFMYGATGSVFDLQAGWPAPDLTNSSDQSTFASDAVRFGDRLVQGLNDGTFARMRVMDLTKITDRNPSTTFFAPTDSYLVPFSGIIRTGGMKAYGDFLVVSEVLSDGTYLEVFDATKVRNFARGQQLSASDSLGRVKVSSYTSSTELVFLTLQHGRAFVSIDDTQDVYGWAPLPNPGLVVVDLRPMLNDTARGTASVVGSIPLKAVRQTAVVGNRLYVASLGNLPNTPSECTTNPPVGFTIWDVSGVMDDASLGAPIVQLGSLPIDEALAINAYGSFVYLATSAPNGFSCVSGTYAIDASDPTHPRVTGYSTEVAGSTREGLTVAGSRLYLSSTYKTEIFNLE